MKLKVIIDLDGICFDAVPRLNRCKNEKGEIDWELAFSNEEVIRDPVIEGAPEAIRKISERYDIVYMTGRSAKCLTATLQSLDKAGFPFGTVIVRSEGDTRPDHIIKREMIECEYDWGEFPLFAVAIDDDYSGKLRGMYLELGIPHYYSFEEFFRHEHSKNLPIKSF